VSIDHEYLGRVDQIEAQNKSLVDEIAKLHQAKALEQQKTEEVLKEVDKLHERIQELEMANQQNETLGGEKHRQLDYEI